MTITRKDYLTGNATHEQYYGQFATDTVQRFVVRHIGEAAIRASRDPHMNDIPLHKWDYMHPVISSMCGAHLREAGVNAYALCDTVCIAKAAARVWLAANPGDIHADANQGV